MVLAYDNWERLVQATIRRVELREIALEHSRTPSETSTSSNLSSDNDSPLRDLSSKNSSPPLLYHEVALGSLEHSRTPSSTSTSSNLSSNNNSPLRDLSSPPLLYREVSLEHYRTPSATSISSNLSSNNDSPLRDLSSPPLLNRQVSLGSLEHYRTPSATSTSSNLSSPPRDLSSPPLLYREVVLGSLEHSRTPSATSTSSNLSSNNYSPLRFLSSKNSSPPLLSLPGSSSQQQNLQVGAGLKNTKLLKKRTSSRLRLDRWIWSRWLSNS